MKVVICGSMCFAKEMLQAAEKLRAAGHESVMPDFIDSYANIKNEKELARESAEKKAKHDLIKSHFNKIKNADAILLINEKKGTIKNYIGANSFLEMGFAHVLGKKIFLLNPLPAKSAFGDELAAMRPVVLEGDLNSELLKL